jgi:hypothetical protein
LYGLSARKRAERPLRYRGFETIKFLRGGDVSPTATPTVKGQGISLPGNSLKTCPAGVAPPVASRRQLRHMANYALIKVQIPSRTKLNLLKPSGNFTYHQV